MRALAIAKKELNVYFTTPIAYVVFTVVAFFAALFFSGSVDAYRTFVMRVSPYEAQGLMERLNLTDVVVSRLFGSVAILFILAAPLLSMRLIADEKRARTFELLMTTPVRPRDIVLGKYLAALAVMAVSVGIVGLFPALLSFFAKGAQGGSGVEWQTVGTGVLGLFLLGAMAMAIGMFVSSLTESVLVAALVSFIVLIALWVTTIFTIGAEGPVKELAQGLSASEHLGAFLQGRIELKSVVYYLSLIVLSLWLTDRAIEGHRWA
ncbi:MAG TPA: ABC transporter permease [Anaeromyxobacteraceae bacterium]|nr:ABC transporter permease [Anaeromyxobacteraceae bacterium]